MIGMKREPASKRFINVKSTGSSSRCLNFQAQRLNRDRIELCRRSECNYANYHESKNLNFRKFTVIRADCLQSCRWAAAEVILNRNEVNTIGHAMAIMSKAFGAVWSRDWLRNLFSLDGREICSITRLYEQGQVIVGVGDCSRCAAVYGRPSGRRSQLGYRRGAQMSLHHSVSPNSSTNIMDNGRSLHLLTGEQIMAIVRKFLPSATDVEQLGEQWESRISRRFFSFECSSSSSHIHNSGGSPRRHSPITETIPRRKLQPLTEQNLQPTSFSLVMNEDVTKLQSANRCSKLPQDQPGQVAWKSTIVSLPTPMQSPRSKRPNLGHNPVDLDMQTKQEEVEEARACLLQSGIENLELKLNKKNLEKGCEPIATSLPQIAASLKSIPTSMVKPNLHSSLPQKNQSLAEFSLSTIQRNVIARIKCSSVVPPPAKTHNSRLINLENFQPQIVGGGKRCLDDIAEPLIKSPVNQLKPQKCASQNLGYSLQHTPSRLPELNRQIFTKCSGNSVNSGSKKASIVWQQALLQFQQCATMDGAADRSYRPVAHASLQRMDFQAQKSNTFSEADKENHLSAGDLKSTDETNGSHQLLSQKLSASGKSRRCSLPFNVSPPVLREAICSTDGATTKAQISPSIMPTFSMTRETPISRPVQAKSSFCISNCDIQNRYQIGSVVGDGHFAIVRFAHDRNTGRECAIKIIDKTRIEGKEKMLRRELRILRQCHHPNIVHLIEEFETPTEFYIIMEYVQGGDLFEAIRKKTCFSECATAAMVSDIGKGLLYLHLRGIVHRDLKPENLLIAEDSSGQIHLKLADFGLAIEVTGPLKTMCGTPTYIAPEILQGNGYGLEVDVWALGVITFVLLSGYPPFRSPSKCQSELFSMIKKGRYEFASPQWDRISQDAKDFINSLLVVNRLNRLPTVEILSHDWVASFSESLH